MTTSPPPAVVVPVSNEDHDYVVSVSGDDTITPEDVTEFIKELEAWLMEQNTVATDAETG